MVGEMKFEESSLSGYLVKHLEPLTEADPAILAAYVVALLKKDKPTEELQALCVENLVEFLGQNTNTFTAELFQALEDGSIVRSDRSLNVIENSEPFQPPVAVGTVQLKNSSPKEENLSTSSDPVSDSEEKEVSDDDDDDDRNHKHRRREAQPDSFDNDGQEQFIKRPNRKRNKLDDNGQLFRETNSQSSEIQKEYNPTSERNISSKFDKRRCGLTPSARPPLDFTARTRLSQSFRTDPGSRFDLSTSAGRPPLGRGRGRSTGSWSQHDSRFNPLETFDFASQLAPQGSAHPGLFVGTGLPNAASAQNPSWGGFGFIPGMPNRILDPLHPLGLQGTLGSAITPPLNLGIPRQHCRDFEERGFCLRGDMCPMEHGLNRIVVEDVQSLSQFNLPVSIPSSHSLGIQAGSGPLPPVPPTSSSLLLNGKVVPSKSSRSGVTDDVVKLNGVSSTSGGADADVYDPDQPLWNNNHPESSNALLKIPSPNMEEEPLWDADSSARQSCRLSDGSEGELASGNVSANTGLQNANSSVWGRIGSGSKPETGRKTNSKMTSTGFRGNKLKEDHEETADARSLSRQGKQSNMEAGPKATAATQSAHRLQPDPFRNTGRPSQRASRTLYVNGIPQINNRIEALHSHFQKFGEVIDIYIPQHSEKAFVQFSKREEAEAALKAPDAVMGNRFIRLFWANRDRIPDEGQSSGHSNSIHSPRVVLSSVASQLSVDGAKENPMFTAQKRNSALSTETSVPSAGTSKGQIANGPKPMPPVQKKLENLEHLKEELRKKQEILAQKRVDFRRQLDKFEKQTISTKKGDLVSEQAVKRQKVDVGKEAAKAVLTRNTNLSTVSAHQDADKTLDKSNSMEVLVSPSSKANSTVLLQSPRNVKQSSSMPVPVLNRFKLDNRTTAFRILPPLPDGLTNVAVLKDHFSPFGAVSSVVLEEPEVHTENAKTERSHNCSACITFTTRSSAERAYHGGKCWEGHSLQFMWLAAPLHSNNDFSIQETSLSFTPKEVVKAEIQSDRSTSESSSDARKASGIIIPEVAAIRDEPPMDVETMDYIPISKPKSPVQILQTSPTISSREKQPFEFGEPVVEDNVDVGFAQ